MQLKTLIIISFVGLIAGISSVIIYNQTIPAQNPIAFSYNPYEIGVYATGIVESRQLNGSNVNIFPEVSGTVTHVFITDGQVVKKGSPLVKIDDSVQIKIVDKDLSQVEYAKANLINQQQQLDKIKTSYKLDPKSTARNSLDIAINNVIMAKENLNTAIAQYNADKALWYKYLIRAPIDGTILRASISKGSYISSIGSYDTYSQQMIPIVQMGVVEPYLQVRCFLDEILVPKLPSKNKLQATMFIRGLTNAEVPLEFVKIQPYTIPNIQLSDERNERVDVRVLPIVFKFKKPTQFNIFPGQLVDVFIKGSE